MSHTVHPFAHRLGIIRDWKSRWFGANKKQYKEFLIADLKTRRLLTSYLRGKYVVDVNIERNEKTLRLIIKTARPGLIIGRNGEEADKLRSKIIDFMKRQKIFNPEQDLKIDIEEVKSPESQAPIIAWMIIEQLEKRMPFRRAMKQAIDKAMANRDVQGVRITLSGRLNGSEMSRTEDMKKGKIPLQTFRADIDYVHDEAHLPYGQIGVKVWIYRGEIFNDKNN